MAGYQPFQTGRASFAHIPPAAPVVDIRLVCRPVEAKAPEPVERKSAGTAKTTEEIEAIHALRRAGRSLQQISDDLGISKTTVRKYCRGVPAPYSPTSRGGSKRRLPLAKAQRMRRAGFTYREIDEEMGTKVGTAWNLLNPRSAASIKPGDGKRSRLLFLIGKAAGIAPRDIKCGSDSRPTTRSVKQSQARHIAFWIMRNRRNMSFPAIAASLGGFDSSTVIHGVRRVDAVISANNLEVDVAIARLIPVLWGADWSVVAPSRKAA